jgi:hypothetical protein
VTTLEAYGYLRTTRHASSAEVDRLTAKLDEHAAHGGLRIVRIFIENDPRHPTAALTRLMTEARAVGGIGRLITPGPTHLSANPLVRARQITRLGSIGLRVIYLDPSATPRTRRQHPARLPPGHDAIPRQR